MPDPCKVKDRIDRETARYTAVYALNGLADLCASMAPGADLGMVKADCLCAILHLIISETERGEPQYTE